jgi:hypothetical protein
MGWSVCPWDLLELTCKQEVNSTTEKAASVAAETSYMMKLFNDAQQSASTVFSSYFLGVPLLSKGGAHVVD